MMTITKLSPQCLACISSKNNVTLQALAPIKLNKPRDEVKAAETRGKLKASLDIIENYFLKDKKFIAGDEISIADLEFISEVTQYWISNNDIYKGRPNMERWVNECRKVLAPHFDAAHERVYELRTAGTYHYTIDVGQTMN